ncbi:hypothetical protein BC834DRAFT_848306 [Gloeopeniophorella convolvens]|nr:hypothetical protein BC834DRAFT_848306 [Gloeopeniophorella convolvens]
MASGHELCVLYLHEESRLYTPTSAVRTTVWDARGSGQGVRWTGCTRPPMFSASFTRAVEEYGFDWAKVSEELERPASDCRDRFHRHPSSRRKGRDNTKARGFWSEVSKRMDGTRTGLQCQNKWSGTLEAKMASAGRARVWTTVDEYNLVTRVASLALENEKDVDWNGLRDAEWNHWSARALQQKWKRLRAKAGGAAMTHQGVVALLVARLVCPAVSAPSV